MTNEEIAAELEALNENATLGRDGTNWGYLIAEQALKEFYRNHHAAIVSALRRGAVAKLQESHAAQFTAVFSVIQFPAVAKLIREVIL